MLILEAKRLKMRYCTISLCKTNSKKQPDLSFFDFPSKRKLLKKWSTFCWWADKEIQYTTILHICSQHFDTKDIFKTLCGIKKEVVNGALQMDWTHKRLQVAQVNKKNEWFHEEEREIKGWKLSEVSNENSLCVVWCRFERSQLYIFPCEDNSSPTEKTLTR